MTNPTLGSDPFARSCHVCWTWRPPQTPARFMAMMHNGRGCCQRPKKNRLWAPQDGVLTLGGVCDWRQGRLGNTGVPPRIGCPSPTFAFNRRRIECPMLGETCGNKWRTVNGVPKRPSPSPKPQKKRDLHAPPQNGTAQFRGSKVVETETRPLVDPTHLIFLRCSCRRGGVN